MRKWAVFVLMLSFMSVLIACADRPDETSNVLELDKISQYTQEQLDEKLIGLSEGELHHSWGEPDGMLSGFWGDIWHLSDASGQQVVIYYDKDGAVEAVRVTEHDSPANQPAALEKLTLEKVKELAAEKGAELSWSDFEQYQNEGDIGSGLYIIAYDIDENCYLLISGTSTQLPPVIRLFSKADDSKYIDIRTESIDDFITSLE